MSCVFCTDPSRAGTIVYEDASTWVILHDDWSPRGHAMVVAKRHVENGSDLDEGELVRLTRVWQQAECVVLQETGAERAILLKLGIATPHFHLHIYPATATDDRAEVFAMFDGLRGAAKDLELVERVRAGMRGRT
ncbi:MAG TPA: HIT family protein [Thermoanaerobaculia bacterium]|jgi:diadenosine tetraphosphate (Ap4A) HIT family hydrolase